MLIFFMKDCSHAQSFFYYLRFMKKIWIALFLSISLNTQAQEFEYQDFTAYYLFNVGYTYQNLNYLEAGLNAYLVRPNNDAIDLGATVNLGYSDGQFIAIPEAQVGYLLSAKETAFDPYSSNFNSAFWVVRGSVSPWHVTPEVGITLLYLIDITAGYGFEFREHPQVDLDGFKIGVSIRLPFLLFWHE